MNALLTIAIPTRNRHGYLSNLCVDLRTALGNLAHPEQVIIKVYDNDSCPDVWRTIEPALHPYHAQVIRQARNVGPHLNQVAGIYECTTPYVWVLPDDETVSPLSLHLILKDLKSQTPDWLVLPFRHPRVRTGYPMFYKDTSNFFEHAQKFFPELIMAAGCWTQNIFRPEFFTRELFQEALENGWSYPHFPALLSCAPTVFLTDHVVIGSQFPPPPPPDNKYSNKYTTDENFKLCIKWLNEKYELHIPPNLPSKLLSRELLVNFIKYPLRYGRLWLPYLLHTESWPKIARRIGKLL